jgi:hypothetical protein
MEKQKSIRDLKKEVNEAELAEYIKKYTEKAKGLCDAYNTLTKLGFNVDPVDHLKGQEEHLLLFCWNDEQCKYVINEMGVLYLANKSQFITLTILSDHDTDHDTDHLIIDQP